MENLKLVDEFSVLLIVAQCFYRTYIGMNYLLSISLRSGKTNKNGQD